MILWFTGHGNGASLDTTTTIADGDQFQATSAPAGGFTAYDTTTPFRGSSAARFSAQATAGITYGEWGSSTAGLSGVGSNTLHYLRGRVRFPVLPPDTTGVPFLQILDSSGNVQGQLIGDINGKIKLADGAGTVLGTSTAAFTTSSWTDVGLAITTYGGAGVGQLEAKIYTSGLVTETLSGSADTLRSGGGNRVRMGMLRSLAFMTVDIQDMAWSPTAYPVLPGISVVESTTTTYASANTATITTGSFTPANNSLLVAYCSMGNGAAVASSLGAVTDSLSGSWTRLAGEASASGGVAEIWARDVVTGASMTVTYDPGGAGASGLDIIVKAYTQAAPVAQQPGATGVNAGGSSYSTSITTTKTGSIVAGALGRATDAQAVVANALTTILGQVNGSSGDTAALFRTSALTATPGATTVGFTNGAAGINRIALAEIVPTSGATLLADASLAVTATLSTSATGTHPVDGSLAVTATLTASATATHIVDAGLAVTATLAAAAIPTHVVNAALPITATLTAAAAATHVADAALAVTATLAAAGVGTHPVDASLPVTATLTAAANFTKTADAALAVTATLAAAATRTAIVDASLPVTATLAASATATHLVDAALPVTATLAAAATRTALITASLPVTATLTASATRTAIIDAALPVTATLTAAMVYTGAAVANLPITATLTAAGTGTHVVDASLPVTATLTATVVSGPIADAALAVVATLAAAATRTALVDAALPVTATLTAAGFATHIVVASLPVTATLAAAALGIRPADAALAITGTLTAAASRTALPTASLPVTASLTAGMQLVALVTASLPVTATLTASAVVGAAPILADAALAVTATLTSSATRTGMGSASLSVTASLTATLAYTGRTAATLSITATIAAGAGQSIAATAALVVIATLTAAANVIGFVQPFGIVDSAGAVASTMDARAGVLVGATGSTSLAESVEVTGGPAYATGERESGVTYTTGEAGW